MTDLALELSKLVRPRLLSQAARAGEAMYERTRHLPRILGRSVPTSHEIALGLLLEREQELEAQRKTGDAVYRAARHVELLIAIRAEAAMWQAPSTDQDQVNASGIDAFLLATYAASASASAGSRAGCW
ncbi:DUF6477 family protein [Donghicola mangrovi]|uniref:DUF6477 family protein n=1 Tax=Donghicola mangrovi TaxID=2729614 RepID=UPI0015A145FE|nr:DUF6477 family protein [Donghicola mangrovi]